MAYKKNKKSNLKDQVVFFTSLTIILLLVGIILFTSTRATQQKLTLNSEAAPRKAANELILINEPAAFSAGEEIVIATTLVNNSPKTVRFSGKTVIGGDWWAGGTGTFTLPPKTTYSMECSTTCTFSWTGEIARLSSVKLAIPVNTKSSWTGTYANAVTANYKIDKTTFTKSLALTPRANKRVFISSASYSGDLGGLQGADSICQQHANTAGLGGTWKAWLSSDTVSVLSRLSKTDASYKRIDGLEVAKGWSDFVDGSLLNPINITEKNTTLNVSWVWTNSTATGAIRQDSGSSCDNWLSTSSGGATGDSSRSDSGWSDYGASACYYNRPLYCIEQ